MKNTVVTFKEAKQKNEKLSMLTAYDYSTAKIIVIVDVGNYRKKRVQTLEELAEKISQRVIKTRKPVTLDPIK